MKLKQLAPRIRTLKPPRKLARPATPRLPGATGSNRRARWLREHPLCMACLRLSPPRYHEGVRVDHVVRLADGGREDDSNLQSLCLRHDLEKQRAEMNGVPACELDYRPDELKARFR